MFESLFFLLGPVGTAGALLVLIAGSVGALAMVTSPASRAPSLASRRMSRV